jgi:hypothetical protein
MPGFYHAFTSTRTTEPDPQSLLAQLRALDATAGVQHQFDTPAYTVKKSSDWTPAHIAAAQTVIDTAPVTTPQLRYTRTSRDKDILTTMAMIVRAKNLAAWNAMTVQQKKDATFAEADVWVNIRDFVETM